MKITADEAREYYRHPSQQKWSRLTPEELPDFLYYGHGGVCVGFHDAHWLGCVMAHLAVKPTAWGRADKPAAEILLAFWEEYHPAAILGWMDKTNRAGLAFTRRIGFREYGRLVLPSGTVIKQEWKA